jgi:hypothetical protein
MTPVKQVKSVEADAGADGNPLGATMSPGQIEMRNLRRVPDKMPVVALLILIVEVRLQPQMPLIDLVD